MIKRLFFLSVVLLLTLSTLGALEASVDLVPGTGPRWGVGYSFKFGYAGTYPNSDAVTVSSFEATFRSSNRVFLAMFSLQTLPWATNRTFPNRDLNSHETDLSLFLLPLNLRFVSKNDDTALLKMSVYLLGTSARLYLPVEDTGFSYDIPCFNWAYALIMESDYVPLYIIYRGGYLRDTWYWGLSAGVSM